MIRWRKQPSETGLARVCQSPRGMDLVDNGEIKIQVRPIMNMRRDIEGWYFYGMRENTARRPIQNLDAAKIAARAFYDSQK